MRRLKLPNVSSGEIIVILMFIRIGSVVVGKILHVLRGMWKTGGRKTRKHDGGGEDETERRERGRFSGLVANVRLQRLGQFQLGHGIGQHVVLAPVEQRVPYGLPALLLQRSRLHPLGRQRRLDLEEHRPEYVVALSVAEHGAHDVYVHSTGVVAHRLRADKYKLLSRSQLYSVDEPGNRALIVRGQRIRWLGGWLDAGIRIPIRPWAPERRGRQWELSRPWEKFPRGNAPTDKIYRFKAIPWNLCVKYWSKTRNSRILENRWRCKQYGKMI